MKILLLLSLHSLTVHAQNKTAGSCDANFEAVYLAKRSCLFDNNKESCNRFANMSFIYPVAGGIAGSAAAILYNIAREKQTDMKDEKLLAQTRNVALAFRDLEKAEAEAFRIFQEADDRTYRQVQKEMLGNSYENDADLQRAIAARSTTKPELIQKYGKDLTVSHLKSEDPEGHKNAVQRNLDLQAQTSVRMRQGMPDLVKSIQDPKTQRAIQEITLTGDAPVNGNHHMALRKEFGSDVDRMQRLRNAVVGTPQQNQRYKQLSPKEKAIWDLLEISNSRPWAHQISSTPSDSRVHLTKHARPRELSVATPGLAGAAAAGVFVPLAYAVGNYLVKSGLENCQSALGLSKDDLTVLNGESFLFADSRASADASIMNRNKCSEIRLKDPEKVLAESKLLNRGRIPAGVCNIMKNEMASLDSAFKNLKLTESTGCNGIRGDNFQLNGDGFQKTFVFLVSTGRQVEAPFDGQAGWPDYSQARVTRNGVEDRAATEDFRARHVRSMPADLSRDNPNPRWDLKELGPCLGKTANTEECRLQRSALISRLYYSNFKENCVPSRSNPAVAVPRVEATAK